MSPDGKPSDKAYMVAQTFNKTSLNSINDLSSKLAELKVKSTERKKIGSPNGKALKQPKDLPKEIKEEENNLVKNISSAQEAINLIVKNGSYSQNKSHIREVHEQIKRFSNDFKPKAAIKANTNRMTTPNITS